MTDDALEADLRRIAKLVDPIPVVDITADPGLHAHEVGGPYADCPECVAKQAASRSRDPR